MKVYTIADPREGFVSIVLAITFIALVIPRFHEAEQFRWIMLISIVVVVVWVSRTLRQVNSIRLCDDGTIEFKRNLGTTRISVRDITGLTGIRKVRDYGQVEWSMWVWHHGDRITVPYFYRAWEFIDDVRAMNPYVPVHGEWPMLYPGAHDVKDSQMPQSPK